MADWGNDSWEIRVDETIFSNSLSEFENLVSQSLVGDVGSTSDWGSSSPQDSTPGEGL